MFILKSGRAIRISAKNCRLICLTSFVVDIIKPIVMSEELSKIKEVFTQIYMHIYNYRSGRSMVSVLHPLVRRTLLDVKARRDCNIHRQIDTSTLSIESVFGNTIVEALL